MSEQVKAALRITLWREKERNLHLTDLSVRALKSGTNKTYWDDSTPGFGVWVGRRAKTWTVVRGRERERITLGRYPDLSLLDARKAAKTLLTQTPEVKQEKIIFQAAKDRFLEEHYRDKSIRAKSEATRLLNKHFTPLLFKELSTVTDFEIEKQLTKLSKTPSEQLHAYRTIRCFFTWSQRPPRRFIKHSPIEGYQPPSKDRKGKRVLTDTELKAVWKAATIHPVVRILILWGTRSTETRLLERAWRDGSLITIPGTFTKNHRDHAIPLLPLATHTLSLQPEGRYYFPSRWGDDHLSDGAWSKIKREIQKASGTKNWQLRDLRRTFRSNMARLKVPRDVCERLINHSPPDLDDIYNKYDYLQEKRAALLKYEKFLQTLLA